MSYHILSQVNDEFLVWLNEKYGSHGAVKAIRGPIHDYLGMMIDFSDDLKVAIDMIDYLTKVCDEFPVDLEKMQNVPCAAPVDLFGVGNVTPLEPEWAEIFHTYIAKLLFACKRARPDII